MYLRYNEFYEERDARHKCFFDGVQWLRHEVALTAHADDVGRAEAACRGRRLRANAEAVFRRPEGRRRFMRLDRFMDSAAAATQPDRARACAAGAAWPVRLERRRRRRPPRRPSAARRRVLRRPWLAASRRPGAAPALVADKRLRARPCLRLPVRRACRAARRERGSSRSASAGPVEALPGGGAAVPLRLRALGRLDGRGLRLEGLRSRRLVRDGALWRRGGRWRFPPLHLGASASAALPAAWARARGPRRCACPRAAAASAAAPPPAQDAERSFTRAAWRSATTARPTRPIRTWPWCATNFCSPTPARLRGHGGAADARHRAGDVPRHGLCDGA